MPLTTLPAFPYGAVYFRKSNPPREDWERDYATAAADGMNAFRHWFLWSAIEVAPGVYDWEEYDRQLDLAAQQGMKTTVAEFITAAPEWAFRAYSHARYETREGHKLTSSMSGSCATGGFPGLCLDNADYRAAAERFLRTLVTRYRGHPGLGGYDIWNECNYNPNTCYCPATEAAFRDWLRARYGDLKSLGHSWRRHSFATWEDVTAPRSIGPFPDTLDWLRFRLENAYSWMRWRAQLIRSLDPECAIVAHGVAGSLTNMAPGGADDWRAAAEVEAFGLTWGSCRHGDEPWKQAHALDLVRAAARGKPFWHAEAYAGPLWMQPQVLNKPRGEGRIASPADIRYWDMASLMAGARGLYYLRWRPLLDGPLFGAFGPYGMDGSRTERSAMTTRVGRWIHAPAQGALWRSHPVQGEIGIVYLPKAQLFSYAQQGNTAHYAQAVQGAYRGFYEHNIQADWVHIEDIAAFKLLYLPIPIALSAEHAAALRAWVAAGGRLIAEGCPAYWDARGHVSPVQPGLGLDELFGAREEYVEFTPDLLGDLRLQVQGETAWGGVFMQAYQPTTGTAVGWYEDGRIAAVDNDYGQGHTRLLGTMVGYGHAAHAASGFGSFTPAPFFAQALAWGGATQHARVSEARVKARLHHGAGGVYLWVANPTAEELPVQIELGETWGPFAQAVTLWGAEAQPSGRAVALTAPARDVTVLRLS
jgi:beta-galactosidase